MRNVMIAAPSYDGSVTAWHAFSLSETCKLGVKKDINVSVVYMSFDALVQRARNDIVQAALDAQVDDLVFIDCDVDWAPDDFFKLLEYDEDVVGAVYPKKGDEETYPVKLLEKDFRNLRGLLPDERGLFEVEGLPTGFLRLRKSVLEKVWEVSEEYREPHKPRPIRMVFNIDVVDGQLVSEDIIFCKKWKDLGGKVYFDPSINLSHVGTKRWSGNYMSWLNRVRQQL